MIKLKAITYKLTTKVNEMPVMHRLFIAFVMVSFMYGANLVVQKIVGFESIETFKNQEKKYAQQFTQFQTDLAQLEALVNQPEKALIEKNILKLEQQIESVDAKIELITRLLIDPKTMTLVLDGIVKKQEHLKLISLKSVDHVKQESLGLYQHQMEITVEGNFLDVARYLHDIEGMPYKVYWKSIDYQTLNSNGSTPNAIVVLTVYTLSREGGWLGV